MFILKSFEYIIKDFSGVYQKVHFNIFNNGNVEAQMFEEDCYKTILPIDIFINRKTLEDVLIFTVIDVLDDEETWEKVDNMIDEVFDEHRKLFANYKFSEEKVQQFYNNKSDKSNEEVKEWIKECKLKETKERYIEKIINDCLK